MLASQGASDGLQLLYSLREYIESVPRKIAVISNHGHCVEQARSGCARQWAAMVSKGWPISRRATSTTARPATSFGLSQAKRDGAVDAEL